MTMNKPFQFLSIRTKSNQKSAEKHLKHTSLLISYDFIFVVVVPIH